MKKPNLVFVFADQMRAMDINRMGNRQVTSPNLDRLCDEGGSFSTCVSCFPVCSPYRASLISGKYPTSVDVLDNDVPLPINGQGFGFALKSAGYTTGWIGKWHLYGGEHLRTAFIPPGEHRHGFDEFTGVNCAHQYFDYFYYKNDDPQKVFFKGYEPDIQTDLAIEYIEKNKDRPFSLFVSYGTPHDPFYDVPQKYKNMYNSEELLFRDNVDPGKLLYDDSLPGNTPNLDSANPKSVYSMHDHYDNSWENRGFPQKEVLRDYYAAITALDYNIGRLTDRLRTLNLLDDTIIVFTSDHGEMMYSQGLVQKNHPYDESVMVPFIVRCNGIQPGTEISAPFNTPDIMPTLLELMDIDPPDYCEGTSFAAALRGEQQELPSAAYIMCSWDWAVPEWRGIRTDRYSYIETKAGPFAMFDNHTDPFQLHNLIDNPDFISVRDVLKEQYVHLQQKIGDPFEPWDIIKERMRQKREVF